MMKNRVRIQVIGNYLDKILHSLNRAGIYTEDLLQAGNPLGFVFMDSKESCKEVFMKFPEAIRKIDNKVTQLTLKKNLDEYLSHDKNTFSSNVIKNEYGKTVRDKNSSSYVLISNTNLAYPLLQYEGNLYADTYPQNSLSKYLNANGAINVIRRPNFSQLKKYFDKYIDILLKEYGNKHIILVKAAPSMYYFKGNKFQQFNEQILELRKLVIEADNYFIKKTNCIVLDSFEQCLPLDVGGAFPCAIYSRFARDELTKDIIKTIYDIEKEQFTSHWALRVPVLQRESLLFEHEKRVFAQFGNDDVEETRLASFEDENQFLQCLNTIIQNKKPPSETDIQRIGEYTKTGKLSIDGLVGIFLLADRGISISTLKDIAFNILHNPNCLPVTRSVQRFVKNIAFLSNYPFYNGKLPPSEEERVFIKINDEYLMQISSKHDIPFQLIAFKNEDKVDIKSVIDKGYCCKINEAEALCKSIKFYIQRAKNGAGNFPIKLTYDSDEVFRQSLYISDYEFLMSNEPFLIGFDRSEIQGFNVRTNLEFLFHERARIVMIRSGLSDQIDHYCVSKCIQSEGMEVYYDDIYARSINAPHLGYELHKIIQERIDDKCFSNILSEQLLSCFDNRELQLPDTLFEEGLYQLMSVANMADHFRYYKQCSRILYEIKEGNNYENIVHLLQGFGPYITYYCCHIRLEYLMLHYPLNVRKLFQFPPFEDQTNCRLQEEMSQYVAVGIHVRRGDYANIAGGTNRDYYKKAILKILNIPEYQNAKFYVFSDNIRWCKANAEGLGLTQVNHNKITYIDHNKGDDSFRDMQLLTLCKVIIGQQGGFARTAYLLSDRCEMFLYPNKKILNLMKKIGRGNKYSIDIL